LQCFMSSTGELRSARFDRLCDALECQGAGDKYRIMGHLVAFMERWGAETEYDAGLLWDVTESTMGRWADWPEARKFGHALVKAGYVVRLAEAYPPELLRDPVSGQERGGYVACAFDGRMAIDVSWNGWHLRRSSREFHCLFLTDPARRWGAVRSVGLDLGKLAIEGRVPAEWVEQYHAWQARMGGAGGPRGGGDDGAEVYTRSRPSLDPGSSAGLDPPFNNVNVENVGEELEPRNSRGAPLIPFRTVDVDVEAAGACGAPPHGHVGKGKGRETNGNGMEGNHEGNHESHAGRGSGRPKSEDLRRALVDLVATDRFGALRALDSTDRACNVWHHCCQDHPALVGTVLTDLLAGWPRIRDPAAWVMKRLHRQFKADRGRSADTSTRGGSAAGARRAAGGRG
jgi:hypothetical protein